MTFLRALKATAILLPLVAMLRPPVSSAQSGTAAALSGNVTDSSGGILQNATVTITFASSGAQRTVRTGSEGKFLFLQLTTGAYRLTVEAPGFASETQQLTYQGSPIHLNVALSAAAAPKSEITVTSTNSEPTEPAHVDITPEQIDRMPTQSLSSPFSSLITMTTPGAVADSNGSFHPLGDHAEATFVVDGQPITDQQSRTFSTQVSLNALQSIEVREGAPGVDVGDKTSMVIVAQTRSGLDQRTPRGTIAISRGSFGTSTASASLAFGTNKFGSFTAIDGLNSRRFLDTPETVALHAHGNAENFIERLDYKPTEKTTLQLNLSLSRSWFQTPNTFDQQDLGQDQRQTVASFNIAPQFLHTFNAHSFNQTNFWLRARIRQSPRLLKIRRRIRENIAGGGAVVPDRSQP